jgi:hypothetical protein
MSTPARARRRILAKEPATRDIAAVIRTPDATKLLSPPRARASDVRGAGGPDGGAMPVTIPA